MARPALEGRLLQALDEQRLVLLVAPGGSGKTALLVRALEQLPEGHDAAWVALDAGDDLHRLLQCLWRALEPFDLPWRTSPDALATMAASAEAREQQRAADEIVNTLEQCELAHGVIALDDLHHVDDAAGPGFHRPRAAAPARALDGGHHHAPPAGAAMPVEVARRRRGHRTGRRRPELHARRGARAAVVGRRRAGRRRGLVPANDGLAGRPASGAGRGARRRPGQRDRSPGLRLPQLRGACATGRRAARVPAANERAARARRRAMRGADRRSADLGAPRGAGATGPFRHRRRRRPANAEAARPVPRHAAPPPAARTPGRA